MELFQFIFVILFGIILGGAISLSLSSLQDIVDITHSIMKDITTSFQDREFAKLVKLMSVLVASSTTILAILLVLLIIS
jgi:hypothetical protein